MAELGVDGPSFHRELGLLARELGVVELVAVGELARDYDAAAWVPVVMVCLLSLTVLLHQEDG